MLADISNHIVPPDALALAPSKLVDLDSSSTTPGPRSSPSSRHAAQSSSPAFFRTSRLDAFDAASSSPPRLALLSTPTKPVAASSSSLLASPRASTTTTTTTTRGAVQKDQVQGEPVRLNLEPSTVLYFGRKANQAIPSRNRRRPRQRSSSSSSSEPEPEQVQSIPVVLPKSAKNASRVHCSVRQLATPPPTASMVQVEVRVTGQNGMRIDGQLWKQGTVATLTFTRHDDHEFRLSFWGWDAIVSVMMIDRHTNDDDHVDDETTRRTAPPPAKDDTTTGSSSKPRPTKRSRVESPSASGSSSSSSSSRHRPPSSSTTPPPTTTTSLLARSIERAENLAASPELDLAGLLASTIVFHPRSTVGVDELVKALLKESGPLLLSAVLNNEEEGSVLVGADEDDDERGEEELAVKAWTPVCQQVLNREQMFGMIDNTGLKDAAGRPLPPYYYYVPDLDSSRARVEALEPFVKRVRGARTSKPIRYFWAKPK